MTDQTTYLSPNLRLVSDSSAFGDLEIIHDDTRIYLGGVGLHPVSDVKEAFRILTALTYTRKDYPDESFGYWANFRDGSEFWVTGKSLHEVVERAAEQIGMYLTGRDGYPLFDGILDLDAVK